MLERMQSIALRFQSLRPYLLVVALAALFGGVYVLLTDNNLVDDVALIPAFMLFTWATMARSFITIFALVPVRVSTQAGLFLRLKVWLRRGVYYIFLVLFALATAFLLLSTWQLSSVWRMMY